MRKYHTPLVKGFNFKLWLFSGIILTILGICILYIPLHEVKGNIAVFGLGMLWVGLTIVSMLFNLLFIEKIKGGFIFTMIATFFLLAYLVGFIAKFHLERSQNDLAKNGLQAFSIIRSVDVWHSWRYSDSYTLNLYFEKEGKKIALEKSIDKNMVKYCIPGDTVIIKYSALDNLNFEVVEYKNKAWQKKLIERFNDN